MVASVSRSACATASELPGLIIGDPATLWSSKLVPQARGVCLSRLPRELYGSSLAMPISGRYRLNVRRTSIATDCAPWAIL